MNTRKLSFIWNFIHYESEHRTLKEFDLIEMFDDYTTDICFNCLRLKITPTYWIYPTPEILGLYFHAKPVKEITLCPVCLEELLTDKIM